MKAKLATAAIALMMTGAGVAHAEDAPAAAPETPSWGTFSGTVSFTSDYRFRGISQTSKKPAVQGSIDWSHACTSDSNVYAGLWGSSVNFGDGGKATLETDVYVGYKFKMAGLNFDTNIMGIFYPGAPGSVNYTYWEGKLMGSYDFGVASVTAGFNYSPNNFGDSGPELFSSATVTVPLAKTGVNLVGSFGYQTIDDAAKFGNIDNYSVWSLGATYKWQGFDLSATYTDTNIGKAVCPRNCDATGFVTVTRAF